MKYVKEPPPTDIQLSRELSVSGWNRLKEPGNLLTAILASIPFMIINGFICWYLFLRFHTPLIIMVGESSLTLHLNLNLIAALLILPFLTLLHEFFHAAFIPNFAKSDKTSWGIRPWGAFVSTSEEVSKRRFLIISLAPLIILSIVLPIIFELLGLLINLMAYAAFINALGASVDMLMLTLVAFQVPSNARIINNGWETFYKTQTE